MAKNLSQDLPDTYDAIDILWEEVGEAEGGALDILPTEEPEVTPEVAPEPTPEVVPEATPEPEEAWEDLNLDNILGDNLEIKEEIDDSIKEVEEIKSTIEEAKEALQEDDTNSATKLIDELYTQVIDYSTTIDTLSTKNDILQTKLKELTISNTDYELKEAQGSNKSNDPKMLILNRMYDWAISGEEFSKNKVITTLEDMYYNLTGKSFDESRIDKVSDKNAGEVILNEWTSPAIKEEPVEEVDLNDITSIF